MRPIETFENQTKGILSQIQVLDVYFLNLMSIIRKQPIPIEAINNMMKAPLVSGYNMLEMFYKPEDFEYFEKNKIIRYAGQQILSSSYTAIENYFIKKFEEYFLHKLNNQDKSFAKTILNNISFRSLKEIKNNYSEYLDIHIPCFDINHFSQPKCNFHPKKSWEGLLLLSDIRNDVAHIGSTDKYKITTLMDCWYPFEFVRNYVNYFEGNFDGFYYQKRKTRLIKLYLENVKKRI